MPERQYDIVWEIEVDANSPEEAAQHALAIHRDPQSTATYFTVIDRETGQRYEIEAEAE